MIRRPACTASGDTLSISRFTATLSRSFAKCYPVLDGKRGNLRTRHLCMV
jgi:hypothetical protein